MARGWCAVLGVVALVVGLGAQQASAEDSDNPGTITTWKWIDVPDKKLKHLVGLTTLTGLDPQTGAPHMAIIGIGCGSGFSSLLMFMWKPDVPSGKGLSLRYQFDGQPERKLAGVLRAGGGYAVIDRAQVREFVKEATSSDSISVRLSFKGRPAIEVSFDAKGGSDMRDKLAEFCPSAVGKK